MQYFAGYARHTVPTVDHVPPTFAGISGLAPNANGSLSATFTPASDVTPPLRYRAYIQASTATGLFAPGNRVLEGFGSPVVIFTLPDGLPLRKGVTYFVGVRAVDGLGNEDSNLATQSAISVGVLDEDAASMAHALLQAVQSLDASASTVEQATLAAEQAAADSLGAVVILDSDASALTQATATLVSANQDILAATAVLHADASGIYNATGQMLSATGELIDVASGLSQVRTDLITVVSALVAQVQALGTATATLTQDITALDAPGLIQAKNDLVATTATLAAKSDQLAADITAVSALSDQLASDIAAIDASALQQVAQDLAQLTVALTALEGQLEAGVANLGELNQTLNTLKDQLTVDIDRLETDLTTFENALDRLVQTLPEDPAVCLLIGNIRNISGRAPTWEKVEILIRPLLLPQASGTSLLCTQVTHWFSNYNGDFTIPVIRGSKVLIEIPLCGVRFQYDVPVDKDNIDLVDVIMNLP